VKIVKAILQAPFIFLIRVYQYVLSPILPRNCRHYPTCSNYTIEAIKEWGVFRGIWLGSKRIARCHPWGTEGYDPVPRKGEAEKAPSPEENE